MIDFLDTSALIKLYIAEDGSERLARRVEDQSVAVSDLAFAEVHATLARRLRESLLTIAEYQLTTRRFAAEWQGLIRVSVSQAVLQLVPGLCQRHPLRSADALQLASALMLREEDLSVTLVACDQRLLGSAAAEKLPVFDPTAAV
ncbi:MAG: type II toxin-antitoxin system VapC family toxin [Acidobacteriota bacterium]|nr:type II toxin-antitoxin system VapC family toxin [Acidobacteriota bacterium]